MKVAAPGVLMFMLVLLAAGALRAAEPSLPACMAGKPAAIVVRIGEQAPRRAWLRGGASPPLEIIDAETGQGLWSAAALPPAAQLFDAMRLPFAGSLLPLDLDGDGIHDRIYAGDLGGRLWRFDLHHALQAQHWATGGMLADFRFPTRGFVAPPDVSLPAAGAPGTPAATRIWFNIALGTARLGPAPVDNRFYVLRDRYPFESWSQEQYDRWHPLREADLVQLPRLGAALAAAAPDGYFIALGGADFLSPALTVSGRATLALTESGATPGTDCAVAAVVSAIDLATGSEAQATEGLPSSRISLSMTAGETFSLRREGSHAACMLGETRVPHCDADLSARSAWWRREDAD